MNTFKASKRKLAPVLFASSALVLTACATSGVMASTGNFLPGVFTQTGKNGPIIQTAEAGDFTAMSEVGKGLATVEFRGELNEFLLDMPQVEAELNAVLADIVAEWPHPIPDDPERQPRVKLQMGTAYKGAAFADGVIILSIGTLGDTQPNRERGPNEITPYIESDQELAFLLGHEFAHYALGHHNKSDYLSGFRSLANDLTGYYNTASTISQLRYRGSGMDGNIEIENQSELQSDISSTLAIFDQIDTATSTALSPAWNRGQEDEADVLGYDLAQKAGYGGPYYDNVFRKLKQQETLQNQLISALNTNLQSSTQELMSPENLQAAFAGQGGAAMQNLANGFQDSLMKQGRQILTGWITQTHRDPEVRKRGLETYVANAYPELDEFDMAEETTDVLMRIRNKPEFTEAIGVTIAYYASIEARKNNNLALAESEIQKAVRSAHGLESPIQFEAARVAEARGQFDIARTRMQVALRDENANQVIWRELARLDIERGKYEDAQATITKGSEALQDADYFLPSEIFLAVRQDNIDLVLSKLSACRDTDREELISLCEARRLGLDPSTLSEEELRALEGQRRSGAGLGWMNRLTDAIPSGGNN